MTRFTAFPPRSDTPRLCGVEIEFAGLTETGTADIAQDILGGEIVRDGAHDLHVEDSRIGRVGIELDTALRKADGIPGLDQGLDLARGLVPVEIVTEPLSPNQMPDLVTLCDALREAGAEGSRSGVLLGFGVHLNPALPETDPSHVGRIALAYGLAEDWLRREGRIDTTRRLMPYIDRWPRELVDNLERERPETVHALAQIYARHTQSRNHGLDLLPVIKDGNPEDFAALFPEIDNVSGRPAYHFRLPDCRIDEPGWSLLEPWSDWLVVERLAADPARLDALAKEWRDHRDNLLGGTHDGWVERSAPIIEEPEEFAA